jgi:hypothetical protein
MPTFATIVPCANNPKRITILTNDLESEVNYHSLNPLKYNIDDIRHQAENQKLEIIFSNAKNLEITTKAIYLSNYAALKAQGVLPIESVSGNICNTIEELEQALLLITA